MPMTSGTWNGGRRLKKKGRRITNLVVEEVSLVDKAANGERFYMYKNQQASPAVRALIEKNLPAARPQVAYDVESVNRMLERLTK